jgi:hypothetical protein
MKSEHCVTARTQGINIICPKPDCGYRWKYSGKFVHYATCPSCRRNIRISENKTAAIASALEGAIQNDSE